MTSFDDPVDTLTDAQVRTYFLVILGRSDLSNEEKYQQFISFFENVRVIREQLQSRRAERPVDGETETEAEGEDWEDILDDIGAEIGAWNPVQLHRDTEAAVQRGLARLQRSRHRDGGWGPMIEKSNLWGTANVVLCSLAVKSAGMVAKVDVDDLLESGLSWIGQHTDEWLVSHLGGSGAMSVLCVSMAVCCFREAAKQGVAQLPPEVRRCVEALIESQNRDGGWDASLWGPEVQSPTRIWSEIAATTFAVQALAAEVDERANKAVFTAADWLVGTQRPDGGWSRLPPDRDPGGVATISDTCGALQGLATAQRLGWSVSRTEEVVDKAVEWLEARERPMLDGHNRIIGWGWLDFEHTCLTLEALVAMPRPCLPLLAANANLLISSQTRNSETLEEGNWPKGDTARITRALVGFYSRLARRSR